MEVSKNAIVHGDCVQVMNALPAESVDLVFADPPFNIGYDYDVYDDSKDHDQYLDWSKKWIGAVHRALKPNGTFWLAIGDEYAAELKIASQEIGFHTRSWVVWYYTFGVNCSRKFTRSHAHLFYFVKNPQDFTFRDNDMANRIPSARQLVYNDARANPLGRLPDDTWILRPQDVADCFTTEEDTWYLPRVAGTFKERAGFHGCQMPEQLLGRIIRCCSNPGDLVMDPFSGSATTVAVAKKLGRQYLGFDLSEDYVKQGRERLERSRLGDPLDGAEEPRMSAPATPGATMKRGKKKNESVPILDTAADLSFEKGLISAFASVSDGFSLDRVIADPNLDQALADACERLGLPGDLSSWNRALFRLRKAGKLADVPTFKRTEITWADGDQFVFASEIALHQMKRDGHASLDEILCNPILAARFDQIAARVAPGKTSFEYRWGALMLRKKSKVATERARTLSFGELAGPYSQYEEVARKTEVNAGIYLLEDSEGQAVYAGETLNLQDRLAQHLVRATDFWLPMILRVKFLPLPTCNVDDLLGYQSLLVEKYRPRFNTRLVGSV